MITTQTSEIDFADVTGAASLNTIKADYANGSSVSSLSNSFVGRRVSLYIGQLTWVSDMKNNILKIV